jgi:hypothetical protein
MKKIIFTIFLASVLLIMPSCEKWLDINQNPNAPDKVEGYLLTAPIFAQMAMAIQYDARMIGRYVQYWSHNTASTTWETHGYDPGSDNGAQMWRHVYWTEGWNLTMLIDDATANQKYDFLGMGYALRAWGWQELTDIHGPIIYRQAFLGQSQFDYDNQDTVYRGVRSLCNSAIAALERTDGSSTLSRGDLIYGGDRSKWLKFTYGILARNYNSLINKSSGEFTYDPDKVIEYVDKSLASNADNALVPFIATTTTDANFFGGMRDNLSVYKQSDYVLSLMDGRVFTGVVDPRLSRLMMRSPDGTYRGVVATYGDPNNTTNNPLRIPTLLGMLVTNTSQPGRYIFSNTAPFPVMTYAEMQFIKAEAAFIKGDKTMALAAYTNGISASIDFVSQYSAAYPGSASYYTGINLGSAISAGEKTAYMSNPLIVPTDPNLLTLSMIMQQKYLALWGYGFNETWVDMRKYHYSNTIYTNWKVELARLYSFNNGQYAYRIRPRYNSEYVWNMETVTKFGGDKLNYQTKPIWFSTTEAEDHDELITTW